jgi:GntR family transcriptional regulator
MRKDARMVFLVDPQSGVPIFRQLMDQVKLSVATGTARPGDEMPSIRSLAVSLGVNPMTISKAYSLLEHDGVLERRPGLTLVVAATAPDQLQVRRLEQLEARLKPAAVLARRLHVSADDAIALFRRLLHADGHKE